MQQPVPQRVRASDADRVMSCSGSLLPPKQPYNPPSVAAESGNVNHMAAEAIVLRKGRDIASIAEPIAAATGASLDDVSFVVAETWRAWPRVMGLFPAPRCEVALDGHYCYGRCDVISADNSHCSILDWKFGYLGEWHPHQLAAYASAARAEYGMPSSGHIDVIEVQVRQGRWWRRSLTSEDIDTWEDRLQRQIHTAGRQWAPSTAACRYCPSRLECPARTQYAQSCAALIESVTRVGCTRESLGVVYERAEHLRQCLREYDDAIADALHDGTIPLPDGRQIEQRETKRDSIDVGTAWPVIANELSWTPNDMMPLLSVSKGALVKRVQACAPRGCKKERSDLLLQRLRTVGAITMTASYRRHIAAAGV